MVDTEQSSTIDPVRFREVLACFPTGVVVVTALVGATPIGMVVGSFTSVSLDPPLVAYLPSKNSKSYARLKDSTKFCINVLSVQQEALCRRFASHSDDKFDGVDWAISIGGSPALAAAAAWIDCTLETIVDAGDHDIVIGRVEALSASETENPLLFFQGGYGGFRSQSLVAPFASDLRNELYVADISREHMENLAEELGFACYAQAVVEGDLVIVAAAGNSPGTGVHIGRRMPFVPPYGSLFFDDDDLTAAASRWGKHRKSIPSQSSLETYASMLGRVRERGWSLGLVAPQHDEVWSDVERFTTRPPTPAVERQFADLLDAVASYYEPEVLPADAHYDVRILAAPVQRGGRTVLALALYGMPLNVDYITLERWIKRLTDTSMDVTAAVARAEERLTNTA